MLQTIESFAQDDERPYVSTLSLISVTYENVGYYYCIKNSLFTNDFQDRIGDLGQEELIFDELFHEKKVARMYLFVEGNLSIWNMNFLSISMVETKLFLWNLSRSDIFLY